MLHLFFSFFTTLQYLLYCTTKSKAHLKNTYWLNYHVSFFLIYNILKAGKINNYNFLIHSVESEKMIVKVSQII